MQLVKKLNLIHLKKINLTKNKFDKTFFQNTKYKIILLLKSYPQNYLIKFTKYSYLIFNQMSKNIKINIGSVKKNIYKSTGVFLVTLNLTNKYLRRSIKGSRLFINMFLKPLLNKQNKETFILKIKGFQKRI